MSLLAMFYLVMIPFPVTSSESAQLMLLVQQSQAQLQELHRILQTSDTSSSQMEELLSISRKMTEGLDRALEPYKESRSFQKAALKMQAEVQPFQETSPHLEDFEKYFPAAADQISSRRQRAHLFQSELRRANEADMANLEAFEAKLVAADAGEVGKLHALSTTKVWETNLRLSMQLSQVLSDLQTLIQDEQSRQIFEQVRNQREKEELKTMFSRRPGAKDD
jgi:hypothetical protein